MSQFHNLKEKLSTVVKIQLCAKATLHISGAIIVLGGIIANDYSKLLKSYHHSHCMLEDTKAHRV